MANHPKKRKRDYVDPEAYAHLHFLQDYLEMELDVIFCGINPGCRSAEVGHHFANPTNHFWRCLHQSCFTPQLLPAYEDFTLPGTFNLGLTNLVDRPSAEQAELSPTEMAAGVPPLLEKVSRYRPRIVCFVGMRIWQMVQKALSKGIESPQARTVALSARSKRKMTGRSWSPPTGLQSYKMVHSSGNNCQAVRPFTVMETLFFAMPSTSGRVVSHQLSDKVKIFAQLKGCVEDIKRSRIDTSQMMAISLGDLR